MEKLKISAPSIKRFSRLLILPSASALSTLERSVLGCLKPPAGTIKFLNPLPSVFKLNQDEVTAEALEINVALPPSPKRGARDLSLG